MANHKVPLELKRLRGTVNVTREKNAEHVEKKLANVSACIFQPGDRVPIPKTLTEPYTRKFFKRLTLALISIGVLSSVDLPHVEFLCITLQQLRAITEQLQKISPFDESFDLWLRRYNILLERFDRLGAKFYLTPGDRSKLHLEDLQIQEKQQNLENKQTTIDLLLANRQQMKE